MFATHDYTPGDYVRHQGLHQLVFEAVFAS